MKNILLLLFGLLTVPAIAQTPGDTLRLSEDLELIALDSHTYLHTSYTDSEEYGRFSSNGIIYISDGEAIIGDTPPDEELATLLLNWLEKQEIEVKAVVVNHFHMDALGGLEAFHRRQIPSYSYAETPKLADSIELPVPQHTFMDSVHIEVGSTLVSAHYFGKGHTPDNITLWIPHTKTLFGGCMFKSLGAGNGNLNDANVKDWPLTVSTIKTYFPGVQTVIPGHGSPGNTALLDYTIRMFSN